jgi:hypothetical protein
MNESFELNIQPSYWLDFKKKGLWKYKFDWVFFDNDFKDREAKDVSSLNLVFSNELNQNTL